MARRYRPYKRRSCRNEDIRWVESERSPRNPPLSLRTPTHSCLLLLICLCSACAEPAPHPDSGASPGGLHSIYVVSHGWHAGIVIPRADISPQDWPQVRDFPAAGYLEVGWGDREFYQRNTPHPGLTIRAALWPTESVLHVVGFSAPVTEYFPGSEIIRIDIGSEQLRRLVHYIASSQETDPDRGSKALGSGLYGNSRFYASHETYHLFNNCNVWSARALEASGCAMRSASALTVGTLMNRARDCADPSAP